MQVNLVSKCSFKKQSISCKGFLKFSKEKNTDLVPYGYKNFDDLNKILLDIPEI